MLDAPSLRPQSAHTGLDLTANSGVRPHSPGEDYLSRTRRACGQAFSSAQWAGKAEIATFWLPQQVFDVGAPLMSGTPAPFRRILSAPSFLSGVLAVGGRAQAPVKLRTARRKIGSSTFLTSPRSLGRFGLPPAMPRSWLARWCYTVSRTSTSAHSRRRTEQSLCVGAAPLPPRRASMTSQREGLAAHGERPWRGLVGVQTLRELDNVHDRFGSSIDSSRRACDQSFGRGRRGAAGACQSAVGKHQANIERPLSRPELSYHRLAALGRAAPGRGGGENSPAQ